MSDPRVHAAEVRQRLRRPPNGHYSSELEIRSPARIRRDLHEQLRRERDEERAANINALWLRAKRTGIIERRWARRQNEASELAQIATAAEFIPVIPTLADILKKCCLHYQVSKIDVLSHRRNARIMLCRHMVMYLARELTLLSYQQIGRRYGGRDHTTVVHALTKMRQWVVRKPSVLADAQAITRALGVADAPT